jgi:hypothetical protein
MNDPAIVALQNRLHSELQSIGFMESLIKESEEQIAATRLALASNRAVVQRLKEALHAVGFRE